MDEFRSVPLNASINHQSIIIHMNFCLILGTIFVNFHLTADTWFRLLKNIPSLNHHTIDILKVLVLDCIAAKRSTAREPLASAMCAYLFKNFYFKSLKDCGKLNNQYISRFCGMETLSDIAFVHIVVVLYQSQWILQYFDSSHPKSNLYIFVYFLTLSLLCIHGEDRNVSG